MISADELRKRVSNVVEKELQQIENLITKSIGEREGVWSVSVNWILDPNSIKELVRLGYKVETHKTDDFSMRNDSTTVSW